MYRTILVPLDGSPFSERALPVAASLAHALKAQLILVRAVSASVFPGLDATDAQVQAVDEAHHYLSSLAAGLSEEDLKVEIATPYGDAAEMIALEIGLRNADAIAVVNGAVRVDLDEGGVCRTARIALGAVAPTPIRAYEAERALEGQVLTPEGIAEAARRAAEATRPIDDIRGAAAYRRYVAGVIVRRMLEGVGSKE